MAPRPSTDISNQWRRMENVVQQKWNKWEAPRADHEKMSRTTHSGPAATNFWEFFLYLLHCKWIRTRSAAVDSFHLLFFNPIHCVICRLFRLFDLKIKKMTFLFKLYFCKILFCFSPPVRTAHTHTHSHTGWYTHWHWSLFCEGQHSAGE